MMDDTVRRSKNAALVGASGIVVQETENTFKVVTRKDKLKGSRVYYMYMCRRSERPRFDFFYSSAKARVRLCLCRSSF